MSVRDESGFTLMELLVTMVMAMVILTAALALVTVTTRSQARISNRVMANQRARPVMNRIIDELHSGCVSPGVAPVQATSSGTSLNFISKTGSAVSPTPDQHIISLSGTNLVESVYPVSSGVAPNWVFATTPSSTTTLLTGVSSSTNGSPPVSIPVFQYFAYAGGALSTTPQTTPLSATDAATTVQVGINFATTPTGAASADAHAPITLTDSVVLRLEPASEDTSDVNLPCV